MTSRRTLLRAVKGSISVGLIATVLASHAADRVPDVPRMLIVDSTGKVVGRYGPPVWVDSGFSVGGVVFTRIGGSLFALPLTNGPTLDKLAFQENHYSTIYFSESNCMGTPFIQFGITAGVLQSVTRPDYYANKKYLYLASSAVSQHINAYSKIVIYDDNICRNLATPESQNGYPSQTPVDLSTLFSEPLTLR